MKLRLGTLAGVLTLALMLVFSAAAPASPNHANNKAVPAASSQPVTATAATPEPHPEIKEALGALRRAKEHMEHAAHDFGGHRVEALKATDAAIRQLELCLKYDKD